MSIIAPPYHFIMFDGVNLLSHFGVHVSGAGTYGSPERDVEKKEVPGRDGELIFDNGRYKNTDVTFKCSILAEDTEDYRRRIQELRSFLGSRIGYKRLEDTYRKDEYRLAAFTAGLDPDEVMLQGSSFDLKFNCKPQRFLKNGEDVITITSTTTIINDTYFDAKPLIRMYSSGSVVVGNCGITLIKPSTVSYVDIDSDIGDCFSGTTNCNNCVTVSTKEYPVLTPGENKITLNGMTKIELTPRWYRI